MTDEEIARHIQFLRTLQHADAGATIYQDTVDAVLRALDAERAARVEAEEQIATLIAEKHDLRTELENAIARLAADDHIRREQQAEMLRLAAEKQAAERARDAALESLALLADAAEDFASSDPDMRSHDEAEARFDGALSCARAALSPANEDKTKEAMG